MISVCLAWTGTCLLCTWISQTEFHMKTRIEKANWSGFSTHVQQARLLNLAHHPLQCLLLRLHCLTPLQLKHLIKTVSLLKILSPFMISSPFGLAEGSTCCRQMNCHWHALNLSKDCENNWNIWKIVYWHCLVNNNMPTITSLTKIKAQFVQLVYLGSTEFCNWKQLNPHQKLGAMENN